MAKKKKDKYLGKQGRDRITGFEGIIISRIKFLFGCDNLGIASKTKDGAPGPTEYFDKARVEITGPGIEPELVQESKPGGLSRDLPRD